MVNSVIAVLISLLVVMLIYSSPTSALAKSPRDVCDLTPRSKCTCENVPERLSAICCSYTSSGNLIACEECSVDTNTGDYVNCHDITGKKSPTTGTANVPQGGGVLEQPQTPKKHGGTVLPKGGGALEQPSTDQRTSAGNSGNDSK
jgi:hypothetical protein